MEKVKKKRCFKKNFKYEMTSGPESFSLITISAQGDVSRKEGVACARAEVKLQLRLSAESTLALAADKLH